MPTLKPWLTTVAGVLRLLYINGKASYDEHCCCPPPTPTPTPTGTPTSAGFPGPGYYCITQWLTTGTCLDLAFYSKECNWIADAQTWNGTYLFGQCLPVSLAPYTYGMRTTDGVLHTTESECQSACQTPPPESF
jgi:hypothetical protein